MEGDEMSKQDESEVTPLKRVLNPKNRGNIVALKDLDINNLTATEQTLLRIINELEEELEKAAPKKGH